MYVKILQKPNGGSSLGCTMGSFYCPCLPAYRRYGVRTSMGRFFYVTYLPLKINTNE